MSNRKGRVFALATLAAATWAALCACEAEAQCKGKQGGSGPTLSSQNPVVAVLSVTQPYSRMTQQQLSTLSVKKLKALVKLQERQMRALQRLQKLPQLQASSAVGLQQVQAQNDLATAALLQREQQQAAQQQVLKVAGN